MTRSVLQPVRTRRIARASNPSPGKTPDHKSLSPATRKTLATIGALWVSFAVSASVSTASANPATASRTNATSTAPAASTLVERGRYIVEGVGLCADCHTPRTEKGEFDRSRWLLGSAISFQPTVPMPWSPAAPPIAGLPSMTEAQGVVFLTTGKRPDGSVPRPPMPEYRLNKSDATAVVAYLKSISK
jgi:mono/diheme cytochrome c family protein